jgi:hypothetical protein
MTERAPRTADPQHAEVGQYSLASYTARSKDGPRRRTRLAVGTPLHLPDRSLAARASNPGTLAEGLHRVPERRPWQGLLPRGVGLVCSGRRFQRFQHRARRGAALPWAAASPNAGRLRPESLASERGATRALPPAPTVVDPESLVNGMLYAYPTQRFQSAWMGIIVHSVQSVFAIVFVLVAVLD